MGFNVNSHVVKGEFDADGLKALLPGIPFAASRIKGHDCIFLSIDVPYLTRNEALAPNLPNPYAALHQLYRALEADGVAVCFNRGLANLNLKLSKLFEGSVLSIESSDDMVDFTVASACGLFTGLQFKAEDVEVVVEDGNIHIYPLVTELAETVVDLSIFDGGPFVVHGRDRLETDDVNRIARLVLKAFLNTEHDVVDILLEDLSHEDEELIYRHDGR